MYFKNWVHLCRFALLLIHNICSFSQLRASIWSSRLGRWSLWSGSPIHYRLLRHWWRRSLQERRICGAWRPTSYGFVSSSFRPSENCCSSVDAFLQQFKRRINGKFEQFAQKEPESLVLQHGQQLRKENPVQIWFSTKDSLKCQEVVYLTWIIRGIFGTVTKTRNLWIWKSEISAPIIFWNSGTKTFFYKMNRKYWTFMLTF